MTSEPDSTSRRRPPTIDLTATEVETEKPAADQQSGAGTGAGAAAASGGRSRMSGYAVSTAIGALAMGAILAGLWLGGLLPGREPAAPPATQAATPAATDDISARLAKIQSAVEARQPDAALASRLAAVEASTKSLGDSLAALNGRVDQVATTAQGALAQAQSAASVADAAKGAAQAGVARSDLDALASRIAALESAVKDLSNNAAQQRPVAADTATRLTVAAEALRATVERGAPYQDELAAVKALGVANDATAPLEPFAADGVPSTAALAQKLAALTPSLQRTSGTAPSDTSYLGRLEAGARNLVRITPIDAPPGDAPSAVVARLNAEAARIDISGALADIAKLPAAEKALADPWVKQVQARDAALAAARRIAAAALAALGKPNTQ